MKWWRNTLNKHSLRFRRFAFKILEKCRFKVSDEHVGNERDITYQQLDLLFVILYLIWAIVALCFDTKDILVVVVNTICIFQTRIRNVISERAYIRSVELKDIVVSRMPTFISCYNLLDCLEVVVSIISFSLILIMIFPGNVINETLISVISVLALVTVCIDSFVYSLKNKYNAQLVLGEGAFQNNIEGD